MLGSGPALAWSVTIPRASRGHSGNGRSGCGGSRKRNHPTGKPWAFTEPLVCDPMQVLAWPAPPTVQVRLRRRRLRGSRRLADPGRISTSRKTAKASSMPNRNSDSSNARPSDFVSGKRWRVMAILTKCGPAENNS